jgi:transposase
MLSKEEFIIMQHYLEEGLSKTAIARKLGINRRTVHRYLKSSKTGPGYQPRPPKPSLLDPFKHYIQGRLEAYPELSVARLQEEIVKQGYQGKYTILREYVVSQRPEIPLPLEIRFEVNPGRQAQADFAVFKTPFGSVYALLIVLSWSRYLWVRFFCHQDQLTLLTGLHEALVAFGGVPDTLLFDRMKAVVARTEADGEAIFTEEMLRFAHHYGFQPKACRPYRAKTKGKVERSVSYLRDSFFYGRTFRDLEDLNHQVEKWLEETANCRIHGTTHEIPAIRLKQEVAYLKPLNPDLFMPIVSFSRRVSRDGYVAYNGNEYSLPQGVGRGAVEVQVSSTQICLYQQEKLLAVHPVLAGRGERLLAPGHRQHLPRSLQRYGGPDSYSSEFIEVECRSLEIYEEVLR